MDTLSKLEVCELRADFKSAMIEAREYMSSCKHNECSCFFSKEEIKKLVDLTKEPSYRLPSGLSREEKRMFILNSAPKGGRKVKNA